MITFSSHNIPGALGTRAYEIEARVHHFFSAREVPSSILGA